MEEKRTAAGAEEPAPKDKVRDLLRPETYPGRVAAVTSVETHMSFVFLAGDRAYKLKKAIRLPYLDFSTVDKREAICRKELVLNRRLANGIYVDVVSLLASDGKLGLEGRGRVVDWLVVMKRLDESLMLDAEILARRLDAERIRPLEQLLAQFYRHARPITVAPELYLARWRRQLRANRTALLHPALGMPVPLVLRIDRAQQRFLARCGDLLTGRLARRKIVDGHGDLRPEHIWLGRPVAVIDCLEFNDEFRTVDPFDEIAYLSVECERLGDAKLGPHITRTLTRMLSDEPALELLAFYRCQRATLRAGLSIAHLLEDKPRTPAKWRPLAMQYLAIARREALHLERVLSTRADRRGARPRAVAGLLGQTTLQREERPASF